MIFFRYRRLRGRGPYEQGELSLSSRFLLRGHRLRPARHPSRAPPPPFEGPLLCPGKPRRYGSHEADRGTTGNSLTGGSQGITVPLPSRRPGLREYLLLFRHARPSYRRHLHGVEAFQEPPRLRLQGHPGRRGSRERHGHRHYALQDRPPGRSRGFFTGPHRSDLRPTGSAISIRPRSTT